MRVRSPRAWLPFAIALILFGCTSNGQTPPSPAPTSVSTSTPSPTTAAATSAKPDPTVKTYVPWAHLYKDHFGAAAAYVCTKHARCRWHFATTTDLGRYWHNITPHGLSDDTNVFEPFFLDRQHVWVAAADCAAGKGRVFRSSDGGDTWQSSKGPSVSCGQGDVIPDFVDPMHGWLTDMSPTGGGASLLRTVDGGVTWHEVPVHTQLGTLPATAATRFTSTANGWNGGGPFTLGQVYSTTDGGLHWNESFGSRHHEPTAFGDIPTRVEDHYTMPVTLRQGQQVRVRLERSWDGGSTWQPGGTVTVGTPADVGSDAAPLPTDVVDDWTSWVAGGPHVFVTHDGGRHWSTRSSPTGSPTSITAASPTTAWMTSSRSLFVTRDAGRSWRTIPIVPREAPGLRVVRAMPEHACPKAVYSPGPIGSPLPARTIGPKAEATSSLAFGLANKHRFFSVTYPAVSTDGEKTWKLDRPCFYYAAAQGASVTTRIGALAPNWAYAWGRGGSFVRVTHDGGSRWLAANLPSITNVTASGTKLRAALYRSHDFYVSSDYGLTWHLEEPDL